VPPAPSHTPPLPTQGSPAQPTHGNTGFPHHPPSPGAVWAGFAPAVGRRGFKCIAGDIHHPPGTPKFPLSLHRTPGSPSASVPKGSALILVLHRSAGHRLGEVRGRDNQSSVPPFGAETPRGSAQRRQPHPAGLQRWVWVGWGPPSPRAPCPRSPIRSWVGKMLAVLGVTGACLHLLLHPRRWMWGRRGGVALVPGAPVGCGRQDTVVASCCPHFAAPASSQGRQLFTIVQTMSETKIICRGDKGQSLGLAVIWGGFQERKPLLQPPVADPHVGRLEDAPAPSQECGQGWGGWQ